MNITIIGIILIVISIILFYSISRKKVDLDQSLKQKKEIENNINTLKQQYQKEEKKLNDINFAIEQSNREIKYINNTINQKQEQHKKILKNIQDIKKQSNNFYNQEKTIVEQQLEQFKKISSKAAENYFDNLQEAYKVAEAGHAKKMARLQEDFNAAAASLSQLKETRKAAYQAVLKQKQIKQNKDNYRLKPTPQDIQDIRSLENLRKTFHKPRVISMLIWSYYFQPIAKKQFPIILQGNTKIGIYKITNTLTDQCYIGQSVDIYKRWADHCKAGLGIDTPVGNKLYQSMLSDGLQNFTFELLCQCSKDQLDRKEKYFIELYQADLFGYNSTKGNK